MSASAIPTLSAFILLLLGTMIALLGVMRLR